MNLPSKPRKNLNQQPSFLVGRRRKPPKRATKKGNESKKSLAGKREDRGSLLFENYPTLPQKACFPVLQRCTVLLLLTARWGRPPVRGLLFAPFGGWWAGRPHLKGGGEEQTARQGGVRRLNGREGGTREERRRRKTLGTYAAD